MRVLRIEIKPLEDALREFRDTYESVRAGKQVSPSLGVYFTSVEALRNFLTPERVKLLVLIRRHRPESVYELAKLSNRDFKNVYDDVRLLERHGILETSTGGGSRKSVIPEVPYDEISVKIPLGIVSEGAEAPYASEKSESEEGEEIQNDRPLARRQQQERYKPKLIRILFIAESPPKDHGRYFYFEDVRSHDALFLELMKVLYPNEFKGARDARQRKRQLLARLQNDGFYLIDAIEDPVTQGIGKARQIREAVPGLLARVESLISKTVPIVLISTRVYEECARGLKERGYRVINERPVKFPAMRWQREFRRQLRAMLSRISEVPA